MNRTAEDLRQYYRWQAQIYDVTRWSFLFGRERILREVAKRVRARKVLEVGCGTGRNLVRLVRLFPDAEITGVDLSADMLGKARRKLKGTGERVRLCEGAYAGGLGGQQGFDVVLFSYCLSMVNPGYEELLRRGLDDLSEAGVLALVDFHATPWGWFRRWMGVNHVRFDGQLLAAIRQLPARLDYCQIAGAYGGAWQYLLCVARRGGTKEAAGETGQAR